jgi:hypothetical protein
MNIRKYLSCAPLLLLINVTSGCTFTRLRAEPIGEVLRWSHGRAVAGAVNPANVELAAVAVDAYTYEVEITNLSDQPVHVMPHQFSLKGVAIVQGHVTASNPDERIRAIDEAIRMKDPLGIGPGLELADSVTELFISSAELGVALSGKETEEMRRNRQERRAAYESRELERERTRFEIEQLRAERHDIEHRYLRRHTLLPNESVRGTLKFDARLLAGQLALSFQQPSGLIQIPFRIYEGNP